MQLSVEESGIGEELLVRSSPNPSQELLQGFSKVVWVLMMRKVWKTVIARAKPEAISH